jgi:hypothetical protein
VIVLRVGTTDQEKIYRVELWKASSLTKVFFVSQNYPVRMITLNQSICNLVVIVKYLSGNILSTTFLTGTQYWRNKVVEVAHDYRDFTFAIADEEEYSNRLKDFGLDDSGEDVNVALLDEKDRKYKMDDEFSEDSLREFLDAYKNGEYYYVF